MSNACLDITEQAQLESDTQELLGAKTPPPTNPWVSNGVCTHNCTYPFMLDSTAEYAQMPMTYCETCQHHIDVSQISQPSE